MSKTYLIVPFASKNEAKSLGAKWDWDKKLWYTNLKNKETLLKIYPEYKEFNNIIGEDRHFGGNELYIDLIPRTSWFNNIRNCINENDWIIIRKYIYERVNYRCECCGTYCKDRIQYDDEYDDECDDKCDDEATGKCEFEKKKELVKWNTIQLEAHERWSYNKETNIQKLERLIALCHRCHSVTHYGLTGLRGLTTLANKHLMKTNKWNKEQVLNHHKQLDIIWRERNKIEWQLDLTIITNSGIMLKQLKSKYEKKATIYSVQAIGIYNWDTIINNSGISLKNIYFENKIRTTICSDEETMNNIGSLFE